MGREMGAGSIFLRWAAGCPWDTALSGLITSPLNKSFTAFSVMPLLQSPDLGCIAYVRRLCTFSQSDGLGTVESE